MIFYRLPNRVRFAKMSLRGLIFSILLLLFYFLYMKNALEKYNRGNTTMGEKIIEVENLIWPVMILSLIHI